MSHPYRDLPAHRFWSRAVSGQPWPALQPLPAPRFTLAPADRIATAGSCFAQHIATHLRRRGRSVLDAEPHHPILHPDYAARIGYGVFSARYGNIYTTRQLTELAEQAFGLRPAIHDHTVPDPGRQGPVWDLLRPSVHADGFATREEAQADRDYHLTRVRAMFETLDVFVFTLGLTECWINARDGHAYPACPGTARGSFDPALHRFANLRHGDCVADLERFLGILRDANPRARVILTVSPVALVATAEDSHVAVATMHSKSTLRSVAGEIAADNDHVQYFPSYEIIASVPSRGRYLEPDLRSVTAEGVDHVMRCFFEAMCGEAGEAPPMEPTATAPGTPFDPVDPLTRRLVEADCDERFNDPAAKR